MSNITGNQSWRQLAAVQVGGAVCLPVLMVGQTVTQGYDFTSALLAIGCGNLILFLMSCFTALAGARQKKSTAELAVDVFGVYGKSFFALAMVISMVGWFSIQLKLMGLCLDFPYSNVVLGVLIALAGLKGLKGVTMLATLFTPLLAMTICLALFMPGNEMDISMDFSSLTLSGLSLVAASSIAAVIDLPTFFREAKSPKEAMIAAFILFCVGLPLIEAAGAYLSIRHPESNIVAMLQQLSENKLWQGWITAFLIMGGWATNNANMYSASVSLQQLLPKTGQTIRILLVCGVGIIVSCFPLLTHLEAFIGSIGIVLSSMGAVMITQIIFKDAKHDNSLCLVNLLIWGIGTAFGFLTMSGSFFLTGIPLLDAFVVALMFQTAFRLFIKSIKPTNQRIFYETDIPQ